MCVYIYMHVCMLNCVYASECACVYTHVNVCIMYVHVFVYCVHVYVHKCVWGGAILLLQCPVRSRASYSWASEEWGLFSMALGPQHT